MAKRARGSTSRPGQRSPLQRAQGRPTAGSNSTSQPIVARPSGLTADEEARAAVIEARIVAEERAADEGRRRTVERRRPSTEGDAEVRRGGSGLAVRAPEEYAYVGRDVRRITLLGGSLIILMLVLWVVAHATGVGPV
jgi:hypothetical protein